MTLRGELDAAAAQQWLWIDEGTSALRDRVVADEVSVHGSSLIVRRVRAKAQGESSEGRDGRNGGVCSVGRSGREPVRLDLPYSSESKPEFVVVGVGSPVRQWSTVSRILSVLERAESAHLRSEVERRASRNGRNCSTRLADEAGSVA